MKTTFKFSMELKDAEDEKNNKVPFNFEIEAEGEEEAARKVVRLLENAKDQLEEKFVTVG